MFADSRYCSGVKGSLKYLGKYSVFALVCGISATMQLLSRLPEDRDIVTSRFSSYLRIPNKEFIRVRPLTSRQ